MAPKGRDQNPSGLGRAIMNRKLKDARKMQESGLYAVDLDSTNRLKSVTQERDLDEFLNTAQLAGTEFTAERRNVKIIQQTSTVSHNPHLLSTQEEKKVLKKHAENKQRLRVPRRPAWTKSTTTQELDKQEKAAFLEWRRGLAELQDQDNFLLTPFERNLEVWRQLWRVLERSHLVIQIVDARNPLRFRCEDLETYVQDVEGPEGEAGTGKNLRRSMLLINKSDLLTAKQRVQWADYFDSQGIKYAFYSAANEAAIQLARKEAADALAREEEELAVRESPSESDEEDSDDDADKIGASFNSQDESDEEDMYFSAEEETEEGQDSRAKVLSVVELEVLFEKLAPDLSKFSDGSGNPPSKHVVGLVGYPNVGKSSTINSLLGEKKVSVSSTPGKTKHFQTIHLSERVVLCDCPGLVFPQFATTKADLVCDGVLPIDQLREYTGPVDLLAKRLPREILEATYGLTIKTRGVEEGGDGSVTAENFLISYAIARGYVRAGQGNPDEARSARYILKDYVNGKLLFCHPPPNISEAEFNEPTHKNALIRWAGKKRAPVTRVGKGADTFIPSNVISTAPNGSILPAQALGSKSRAVDQDFFETNSALKAKPFVSSGKEFARAQAYPHQNAVTNDGTPIPPNQARLIALLHQNSDSGKKHKKMKRTKQRSGKGYD
ncbi:P-loop containing nucleoside triphosphate hydrolase protein [Pholiota conissans]|uniref:P-loop containing nucleoside triphosphate hydrolase protein n=1 Tax=Pholiota conissans TaxID=109636 RepID=A0A9P5Z136_9AGAR|nr:P-loop containing nucleoside triphosphate hydrolase protein [Pholiota conissans]